MDNTKESKKEYAKKWTMLKAPRKYAQYWWRETPHSLPSAHTTNNDHPYRYAFTCNRDRVMYSSAFRRLSSKTQIFVTSTSDNLRTRLTHTLEVSQIARTMAECLDLDSDLTEAIALAHDLGHTPFGHVGERTINQFSKGNDKRIKKEDNFPVNIPPEMQGFKHNLQSVRILAEYCDNVRFSNFLLYGAREHSKRFWKSENDIPFYDIYDSYCSYQPPNEDTLFPAWSFEAFIVKWADEIAQRYHDIEDAYLQKIMRPDEIISKLSSLVQLINNSYLLNKYHRLQTEVSHLEHRPTYSSHAFIHTLSSFLIDTYVTLLVEEFNKAFTSFSEVHEIDKPEDFEGKYLSIGEKEIQNLMSFSSSKIYSVDKELGNILKYTILDSYEVQRMDGKGAFVVRKLLRAYISNPQQLPDEFIAKLIKTELKRNLSKDVFDDLFCQIKQDMGDTYNDNIDGWKVYECREVLRIIKSKEHLESTIYAILLRVVFDYVSGMTDTYALKQYKELY